MLTVLAPGSIVLVDDSITGPLTEWEVVSVESYEKSTNTAEGYVTQTHRVRLRRRLSGDDD